MPPSPEELRTEARRLREAVKEISDLELKKDLAARALGLSERAEAIERCTQSPEIVRANIDRYRSMLANGIDNEQQRKIVGEMLADAEQILLSNRRTVRRSAQR